MYEKLIISEEDICAGVLKTGLPAIIIHGLLTHCELLLSGQRHERNQGRALLADLLAGHYLVIARADDTILCHDDYSNNEIICRARETLTLIETY